MAKKDKARYQREMRNYNKGNWSILSKIYWNIKLLFSKFW